MSQIFSVRFRTSFSRIYYVAGLLWVISFLMSASTNSYAQTVMIVCDSSKDRVVRLEDRDSSGNVEMESPGEVIIFYDDESPGPDLSTPSGLSLAPDGNVYLVDGGSLDSIMILKDNNDDGDANDSGEFSIFYDETSEGPDMTTPNAIVFDSAGELFLIDDGGGKGIILGLKDDNGDGDALDEGEWRVLYDSEVMSQVKTGLPVITDPEALAIDALDRLFITDAKLQIIFVAHDLDGDGDVMDAGEIKEFYRVDGAHSFADPEGLAFARTGELFATDEDTGLIVKLLDVNGDGFAEGSEEVILFIDSGALLAPRDTNDLIVNENGALVVLDGSRDQIFLVKDNDEDGTAFSEGEVTPILIPDEGVLGTPSGILLISQQVEFVRGNVNNDERINLPDVQSILGYLFLGWATPECLDSADVNDNGNVSIEDPIFLLGHLFLGGEDPPEPFPQSGLDPTGDELDCKK